ncbi:MAG: hypothetical protein IT324_31330 [Anaerolineae bacterium]|nr:hypothetical protein [Anaerolineae bacterium]
MALNLTCPQCGKRMTMDFSTNKVLCKACGYVRPDEIAALDSTTQAVKAQPQRPVVKITHRGEVNGAALAAFETGQDWLYKGDKQQALAAFLRAIDVQEDFADANLWAARLVDDPQRKHTFLDNILVHDPNHLEALRLLMVLDGRLTPEQAAQTYHDQDATVQAADNVAARGTELLCPSCGGHLTEFDGRVECRFCGYTGPQAQQPIREDILTMALLERKAKSVVWNVGKRTVKCQQCGAEHTIPAEKLSQRCRFCGSTQVVLNDALGSFEQPDCLIPFSLTAEDALACINEQLNSVGARIANFFNSNRVAKSQIDGVYLPFWVFDVNVQLTETRTTNMLTTTSPAGMDLATDVAVCAVQSPPRALTQQLGGYVMAGAVPYEPKWLAKHPAQLYTLDFDRASLDAREVVSKAMKAKHDKTSQRADMENYRSNRYERQYNVEIVRITTQIHSMTFQLVLMPVWIATLVEDDGDVRMAVVNGQTGTVSKRFLLLSSR